MDIRKVNRFLDNLDREGLYQIAQQLLLNEESKPFIYKSIEKWDRAFSLKK